VQLELFDPAGKYEYARCADTKTLIVTQDVETKNVIGYEKSQAIVERESGVATLAVVRAGGIRDKIICSYEIAEVSGIEETSILTNGSFEIGPYQTKVLKSFSLSQPPSMIEEKVANQDEGSALAIVITEAHGVQEETHARVSRHNVCRITRKAS